MRASLKIALLAALLATGCATLGPPRRFADIPSAAPEECAAVRAALESVLAEEPYFSKPVDPPAMSFLAITPYLTADPFDENPYELLKDQAPVDLRACVGGDLKGPRGRVMLFNYPEQLRNVEIIDSHGWVSRPLINGDTATVVLTRGQCYRSSTVELSRAGGAWKATSIKHASSDVGWIGRDPCSPWP